MIAKGDYLQAQFTYAEGALKYVMQTPNTNWGKGNGANLAFGVLSDAVYAGSPNAGNATGLMLTTGWNVNAAYEHFWNSQWRTSLYGGYAEVSYDAMANANLCAMEANAVGAAAPGTRGSNAVAMAGCDNDWSTWWLGSRTQWNITSDFYMGVDVLYQQLNSASLVNGITTPAITAGAGGPTGSVFHNVDNEDNWAVRFRIHKDFYP